MSEFDPQCYQKYAESCRKEGQLQTAGNYYTNAAFGWFMKFRYIPNENKDLDGECSDNIKPAYIGYSISDLIFHPSVTVSTKYHMSVEIGVC